MGVRLAVRRLLGRRREGLKWMSTAAAASCRRRRSPTHACCPPGPPPAVPADNVTISGSGSSATSRPWLDSSLPLDQRVEALLAALTPQQKVAQLQTDAGGGVPELGLPPISWQVRPAAWKPAEKCACCAWTACNNAAARKGAGQQHKRAHVCPAAAVRVRPWLQDRGGGRAAASGHVWRSHHLSTESGDGAWGMHGGAAAWGARLLPLCRRCALPAVPGHSLQLPQLSARSWFLIMPCLVGRRVPLLTML